jgi:hypothetical protein
MQDPRALTSKPNMLDDLIGATYARISTAKQKDGISLDDQDDGMVLYTAQQSIVVPDDYRFKEQGSGFKEERTEYDKIRQLVRERRINVLVVYGSDRHTRDPIHGEIFRAELRGTMLPYTASLRVGKWISSVQPASSSAGKWTTSTARRYPWLALQQATIRHLGRHRCLRHSQRRNLRWYVLRKQMEDGRNRDRQEKTQPSSEGGVDTHCCTGDYSS